MTLNIAPVMVTKFLDTQNRAMKSRGVAQLEITNINLLLCILINYVYQELCIT